MRDQQPTPIMARLTGERVTDLVLGGQLGAGPNGEVYTASKPDGAGDAFVVKVMKRRSRNEDERLRQFRAETVTLQSAHLPGVLSPVKFQTLDGGEIAVVQERCNFPTLRQLRGSLTPREFIEVLKATATVLGEAHKVGCFHGHLHESNIFVDNERDSPRIKISGFGTIHLLEDEPHDPIELLHDDIFALGLVAFREVSGREYRGPEDLAQLIRDSVIFPIRFCQAVERWLDPDRAKRPQKIHQVIGLLEYALASTDPAQTFPVGVSKGVVPSAAIIRPPRTSISEVSEALEDGGESDRRAIREWRSCGGMMLWLDDGGILWKRHEGGDDTLVDTGGIEPTAFAVSHDSLAFAVEGGEVHVIEESGIRRVSQLGRDAVAIAPSSRLRRFVAATVDGRLWYKTSDAPRARPIGFLNPEERIDLLLVGEQLLVRHADNAWLADPEHPDDFEFVFDGVIRIEGGYDPRTFVIWTGRRWSLYDLGGELLETSRTSAGPRPGRMNANSYATYRDLFVQED